MTSDGAASIGDVRVYTDADDITRWEDLDLATALVDFAPPAPPVSMTSPLTASGVLFPVVPAGWTDPAHPVPARQYVFVLTGEMLGSVGGEERRFRPGGDLPDGGHPRPGARADGADRPHAGGRAPLGHIRTEFAV